MLAQVDIERKAIGAHRPVHISVVGDVAATARAVTAVLDDADQAGYRSTGAARAAGPRGPLAGRAVRGRERRRPDRPAHAQHRARRPAARRADRGDRLGQLHGLPVDVPVVPDAEGFCFTQAFQSVGLGLASAIGSAIANPDRLVVAALGDGGALMGISELETAVRLNLPMVIVVYDDEAYGAEVHHFGPDGHPLDTVRFPPADLAQIARGYGCAARPGTPARRPGPGPRMAGRPARPAAADRREDHLRPRLLVARGGLPTPTEINCAQAG